MSEAESVERRPPSRVTRVIRVIFMSVVATTLFLNVLGFAGGYALIFDIWNHFTPIWLIVGIVSFLIAAPMRMKATASLAVFIVMIGVIRFAPYYLPALPAANATPDETLRIAIMNVNYENKNYGAIIQQIEEWNYPDIVVFPEIKDRLVENLTELEDDYPQRVRTAIGRGGYGIAVYTKLPMETIPFEADWPVLEHRMIRATLNQNGTSFTLISVHPRSVHTPARSEHIPQLRAIAEIVEETKGPLILAGDFNTTPWSPNLKGVIRADDLVDVRWGHGFQPTWPNRFSFLPIDGCYVSRHYVVNKVTRGGQIGSDHLPLLIEVARH